MHAAVKFHYGAHFLVARWQNAPFQTSRRSHPARADQPAQLWEGWIDAEDQRRRSFLVSMTWRKLGPGEYLYRKNGSIERSLGPRSEKTEAMRAFMPGGSAIDNASPTSELETQALWKLSDEGRRRREMSRQRPQELLRQGLRLFRL